VAALLMLWRLSMTPGRDADTVTSSSAAGSHIGSQQDRTANHLALTDSVNTSFGWTQASLCQGKLGTLRTSVLQQPKLPAAKTKETHEWNEDIAVQFQKAT